MNSEAVIKVIDTICDKLGLAVNSAKDFVPMLAKYQIVSNIFDSVMSALIIAISILAIKKAFKTAEKIIKKENERGISLFYRRDSVWDFWYTWVSVIVGVIAIIIFVIIFLNSAHDVLTWSTSPEACSINYVLGILNDM